MSANNPKHGDKIIERQENAVGGEKLVASKQFQRFLDELAALANLDTDDLQQLLEGISAAFQSKLSTLQASISTLFDIGQDVHVNNSEIRQLKADNVRLSKIVEENAQELAVLQSAMNSILASSKDMKSTIADMEQLINEH